MTLDNVQLCTSLCHLANYNFPARLKSRLDRFVCSRKSIFACILSMVHNARETHSSSYGPKIDQDIRLSEDDSLTRLVQIYYR